jgi:hypothetical protein
MTQSCHNLCIKIESDMNCQMQQGPAIFFHWKERPLIAQLWQRYINRKHCSVVFNWASFQERIWHTNPKKQLQHEGFLEIEKLQKMNKLPPPNHDFFAQEPTSLNETNRRTWKKRILQVTFYWKGKYIILPDDMWKEWVMTIQKNQFGKHNQEGNYKGVG